MLTVRSEFLLSSCREFPRGLPARFCIRDFASEYSCQNKRYQNYQRQAVRLENIRLTTAVQTKNLFGVKQLEVIPSSSVPTRRMKFTMRRKTERNIAKEKIQTMVANASATLLLGSEGATPELGLAPSTIQTRIQQTRRFLEWAWRSRPILSPP